jgi:pimeloyl-ACP methyl ester carboxylesterase
VARQYRDLRHWHELDRGGHFAAAEVPELVAAELQAFVAESCLADDRFVDLSSQWSVQ